MEFKLIVFDLAGTTVKDNNDVHKVLQAALRKHGTEITIEEANGVMGIPKPVAIHKLLMDKGNHITPVTNEIVEEIHHDFVRGMVSFYQEDASVAEKEGVSSTFAILKKRGLKVAINTGFDRIITDTLLERLGWKQRNLIDRSVASDEVVRGRPYPDMILKLMVESGVRHGNYVVKVGDTASDIQEGRASGCGMVVGVTSGAFSKTELELHEPDHLIEQIPEILDLVNKA